MKIYRNIIKRIFDFFTAFIGLIIISPILVFLIISLAIANNGKPFFYQLRTGKHGKIFKIVKFRTMNDKTDKDGNLLPDEQRITKVGGFCRKLSLDEIPQLFNILFGSMSLIGPRPLLPKYLDRYSKRQKRRHLVMPGITGWAQVNGRNAITWEEKFELDNYYVDHQSFSLDCKIFVMTIKNVLGKKDINTADNKAMPEFMGSNNE